MERLINIAMIIIILSVGVIFYQTINDINSGVIIKTVNSIQGGN